MRGLFKKVMAVRRPVVFQDKEGLYGMCWDEPHEPRQIIICLARHKRTPPSKTYLHECLHIIFGPKVSETRIRKLEAEVWAKMTPRQHFLLAKKLYNRRWRSR